MLGRVFWYILTDVSEVLTAYFRVMNEISGFCGGDDGGGSEHC
jgi:hypothetical protein